MTATETNTASNIEILKKEFYWQVKLNRPDKRNAFTPEMISDLTKFFKTANTDPAMRAVVLAGHGHSFCAGADIEWMRSMADYTYEENISDAEALFAMYEAARNCPLPIVGLLHGYVMGGGVGLAAVCDIALAEASTKFCFSEVKLGIIPAVISSFVLDKMSRSKARELMITGRIFDAQTACEAGLVEFSGRELEIKQYYNETMKCIAEAGPQAMREVKRLLSFLRSATPDAAKKESVRSIAERRTHPEGQEGMQSFLKKTDPPWKFAYEPQD